jgi:hypothetical protein
VSGVVTAFVDQVARDKAQKAVDDLSGHEDLCAERYKNINDTLKTIKSILAWAGTTIFGLLIATLGWLVIQQVSRNDDDKTLLKAQVELLQQQMRPITVQEPTAR